MAHVVIFDVSINVRYIVTGRFEVRPNWELVLTVVNHLDAIGIDDLLLLKVPPGVLGHLLVLLEPVARPQLEGFEVLGADHHSMIDVVLNLGFGLVLLEHLEGEGTAGHIVSGEGQICFVRN